MTEQIVAVEVADVRFPTSRTLDGSDAVNPDPDYSAAYVTVRTGHGAEGYALAFTIGRGTDVQAAAIRALSHLVVGWPVGEENLGALSQRLAGDSPMRWLGPEKGVVHMAVGAILNAVWDLHARRAEQPLWRMVSQLSPEQLAELIDFRYLHDALPPEEAIDILRQAEAGRAERIGKLLSHGYPAYNSSVGWIGYDDEKLLRLCRRAVNDGFTHLKLKVGRNLTDDIRRMQLVRETVGAQIRIAVDANQAWSVDEAISWVDALKPYDPYWIEEPTSPDDVLGHAAIRNAVAPVRVATGEHVHNRVMFKQLLQAGAVDVVQIDACRVGGVNENLAIMLLAAKYGVPVCPHAGGVGLCEMVQHLAMIDFVAISGTMTGRVIEYVDHLHEHFTDPVVVRGGHYLAPRTPGFSTRMHPASVAEYGYPDGPVWRVAADGSGQLEGAAT